MGSLSFDFYNETFPVAAPAEEVFALLADVARWPSWARGIPRAWAPKELRAGSWLRFTPRFLGFPVWARLIEVTPARRLAWGVRLPLFEVVHGFSIEPDGPDRCRVHHREHAAGALGQGLRPLARPIERFDRGWSEDLVAHLAARPR